MVSDSPLKLSKPGVGVRGIHGKLACRADVHSRQVADGVIGLGVAESACEAAIHRVAECFSASRSRNSRIHFTTSARSASVGCFFVSSGGISLVWSFSKTSSHSFARFTMPAMLSSWLRSSDADCFL